ncbi:MAG: PD-(D/E)XK nuclease domain-containing protein, partial [Bacteroidales bacterium]|nr:PD-(D/E)XK nuclease domain-containing protein [Bacteroidales bacterium]
NFERIFLTGVSPVTLEDLTSGFNIASYVSQYQELNQMLGFSEVDVREMIKYYHSVGKIKGDLAQQTDFIISTIKPWCDNYYFSYKSFDTNEPPMYNGMMVMYYLNRYMQDGSFPEDMTAPNTMIDYGKLDHLVKIEQEMGNDYRNSFINKAVSTDFILGHVKEHFAAINILEDENFISLMYYYGMLTICGGFGALLKLRIPNNNIRKQFYTYIRSRFPKAAAVNIAELEIQFANAAILGEWKEMLTYIATSYSKASSIRNAAEGERNIQGYFMAYLNLAPYYLMCPELECNHGYCDIFLMPDRHVSDVQHSYIIEFKYISTKEKPDKTQDKFAEAKAQLEIYAADEKVKNLTENTTLHKIVMVFRGADLELMEECF